MPTFMRRALVAAGAAGAAIAFSAPASANPGDAPCPLALVPVCVLLPAYPNLDHDVDLTQDPDALDGAAATPFPAPPSSGPTG